MHHLVDESIRNERVKELTETAKQEDTQIVDHNLFLNGLEGPTSFIPIDQFTFQRIGYQPD